MNISMSQYQIADMDNIGIPGLGFLKKNLDDIWPYIIKRKIYSNIVGLDIEIIILFITLVDYFYNGPIAVA